MTQTAHIPPPEVKSQDPNKEQQIRVKEVYKLLWEAEEKHGLVSYRQLADYVYQKTGTKISHRVIQKYKIDRTAQLKACGILLAEKELIVKYLDNPKLLYPELLIKIKNLEPNKTTKRIINILTWTIAIIVVSIAYWGYNYYVNPSKEAIAEYRLILEKNDTSSVFAKITNPRSLVSGYLYVDDINGLESFPKGIIIDEETGLINITNVPINILRKYLEGISADGELMVTSY
jgi:hypothetical protein